MGKFPLSIKTKILIGILSVLVVSGGALFFYSYNYRAESFANAAGSPYKLGNRLKTANCKANGPLPDAKCTPGAIQTTSTKIICFQSTKLSRNVTVATTNKVYKEYNITKPVNNVGKNQKYEVDHLIPLELGGSNDISNLFPESASPTPGFREKDKIENYLHKLVCSGKMLIEDAQYGIATNWLQYYDGTYSTGTIIISTSTITDSPPVKKSIADICHQLGTTFYNRTVYFTPYNSVADCLKSGGRLPER